MIYNQIWQGACIKGGVCGEFFDAAVPGNIQLDYSKKYEFGDVNFGDNCKKFRELEGCSWLYRTNIEYDKKADERVFFVTKGIEYEYDIILNSKKLLHYEGMFSAVEIDITDELENGNLLEIYIYPHPIREGAPKGTRDEADQSCKAAVEYGWDWAPRLLISGLWNDTYIETRTDESITDCEVSYELNAERTAASVSFDVCCKSATHKEIYSPTGELVYSGDADTAELDNIMLWWCNGQGEPNLYRWVVKSATDEKSGFIGFRTVELVMNEGSWDEPSTFPKSRSNPPFTIRLNGREIFAKGSNWVHPELFNGTINGNTYESLLRLVKDAHMNILRCWGGAIVNKEPFFEICDRLGIMVWQEFPLACNNYVGTKSYLSVLEQEATAIIKRIRRHACLVLWCGGNELFNNWSKMTDQSPALRLLNKLCYELDNKTPFIMTSPVMGVGHGPYVLIERLTGKTVYEILGNAKNTAYTEFGIPVISEFENLEKIIPEDILYNPQPGTAWETHNGYSAFPVEGYDTWLCFELLDKVFGKQSGIKEYIDKSNLLQCEGLKYIFEEARRQKPLCSMVINWCYNEPWINAACESIISYPAKPRRAYYAVKEALRPVIPSAQPEAFKYTAGDTLSADIWLLNDSVDAVSDTVEVFIEIGGERKRLMIWETGELAPNTNMRGHKIQFKLPLMETQLIKLILSADCGESTYTFLVEERVEDESLANALNV